MVGLIGEKPVALNALELVIIDKLIARADGGGRQPQLLFLGYPDALVDAATWLIEGMTFAQAPKRQNATQVWREHSRPHLAEEPMVETTALFRARGADVTVSDAISWGGEDIVLDLNRPVKRALRNAFDIIVDPGTLEHCFNIAQAFANVDAMLKTSGIVYHQAAAAFAESRPLEHQPDCFLRFL